MRTFIYYTSVIIVFTALMAGIDSYFGPEIKTFSTIIFFAWVAQMLSSNWEKIKEFLKVLYGLDKK